MNIRIKRKRFKKVHALDWMPKKLHIQDIKTAKKHITKSIGRILNMAVLYGYDSKEEREAQDNMDIYNFKTAQEHNNEFEYKTYVLLCAMQAKKLL